MYVLAAEAAAMGTYRALGNRSTRRYFELVSRRLNSVRVQVSDKHVVGLICSETGHQYPLGHNR